MPALHNADQEQLQKLLLGQLSTAAVERLATEYADDGRLAELAESLTGQEASSVGLGATVVITTNSMHSNSTVTPKCTYLLVR